jgi:hypothetical protein
MFTGVDRAPSSSGPGQKQELRRRTEGPPRSRAQESRDYGRVAAIRAYVSSRFGAPFSNRWKSRDSVLAKRKGASSLLVTICKILMRVIRGHQHSPPRAVARSLLAGITTRSTSVTPSRLHSAKDLT